MDFILKKDIEIVESVFDEQGNLRVKHEYGQTREEEDFEEALDHVLATLSDKDDEIDEYKEREEERDLCISEMKKHINKLEKMLTKREVNFKEWKETEEGFNFIF